jgi:Flp pilus assembly pilin Flp
MQALKQSGRCWLTVLTSRAKIGGGFWSDENGQDLIEYTLLLAFVALSGAALYIGMGQTINGIWGIVNSRLAAANQSS